MRSGRALGSQERYKLYCLRCKQTNSLLTNTKWRLPLGNPPRKRKKKVTNFLCWRIPRTVCALTTICSRIWMTAIGKRSKRNWRRAGFLPLPSTTWSLTSFWSTRSKTWKTRLRQCTPSSRTGGSRTASRSLWVRGGWVGWTRGGHQAPFFHILKRGSLVSSIIWTFHLVHYFCIFSLGRSSPDLVEKNGRSFDLAACFFDRPWRPRCGAY